MVKNKKYDSYLVRIPILTKDHKENWTGEELTEALKGLDNPRILDMETDADEDALLFSDDEGLLESLEELVRDSSFYDFAMYGPELFWDIREQDWIIKYKGKDIKWNDGDWVSQLPEEDQPADFDIVLIDQEWDKDDEPFYQGGENGLKEYIWNQLKDGGDFGGFTTATGEQWKHMKKTGEDPR